MMRTAHRRPPGAFTPAVKLLVRKRAGDGDIFDARCEACSVWLGATGGQFQHRAARGAGGCKDSVVNGCANAALMCYPCHRRAEERNPDLGMGDGGRGFWLKHGTTPEYDPRNVPIVLRGGMTKYLGEDGRYYDRSPLEEVAA